MGLTAFQSRSFDLLYAHIETGTPFTKRQRARYERLKKLMLTPTPPKENGTK